MTKNIVPNRSTLDASKERNARRFWISIVLAFFSLDISIAVVAIVMAAGDPSFRPMPDYGDQSVTWESHHQERLSSEKLGWTVEVLPVEPDRQAIDFVVLDREGKPVCGAGGKASAYHLTRVAQQQHSAVEEIEPGRYQAHIDCHQLGLWKIELHLRRNREPSSNTSSSEDAFVLESTKEFSAAEL